MGTNAALILQLVILATEQIQKWQQTVAQANAEGRDVTDAEKAQASTDYASVHAQVDAALGS